MTIEEADKIFNSWKEYGEINDKLMNFFMFTGIPESFLPYPTSVLEEALNMIAKNSFDTGDFKKSEAIQNTIAFLLLYKNDNEALNDITNSPILKTQIIKDSIISNLKKSKDSWDKFKENNN